MRISDWSSDVCSSDLAVAGVRSAQLRDLRLVLRERHFGQARIVDQAPAAVVVPAGLFVDGQGFGPVACTVAEQQFRQRSEERRVGKECVRTCRSRWSPYP